jgi:hypothetical protein
MTGHPDGETATGRLRRHGSRTRGYEANLCRLPLFCSSQSRGGRAVKQTPVDAGRLYGAPVLVASTATMHDGYLLFDLCSTFLALGCPPSNRVPITLGGAARILGASSVGGSQRRCVARSLMRLRGIALQSTIRDASGRHGVFTGGLITRSWVATRGGGTGWVELSKELAGLVREGFVTFAHEPTARRLLELDSLSWRLWAFLEGETIPHSFTYPLFAGTGSVPAISDLLRLRSRAKRRIAMRVLRAAKVIEEADPRYSLRLAKRPRAGWCLEVARGSNPVGHRGMGMRGTRDQREGQWRPSGGALDAAVRAAEDGPPSFNPSYSTSISTVVRSGSRNNEPERIGSILEIFLPDLSVCATRSARPPRST